MTLAQIKRYAKYIQKKWRLTDWKIDIRLDDLAKEGTDASIEWQTDYKQATILVCSDMCESRTKESIRHEFLHLLLEGHTDCSDRDPMFEFGLNVLSKVTN